MTPTEQNFESLDDLSAIMNLQRQEAFDDSLEEVHTKLSRREQIRNYLTTTTNTTDINGGESKLSHSLSPPSNTKGDDAESKLLQIIMSQAGGETISHEPPTRRSTSAPRRSLDRRRKSAPNVFHSDDEDVSTNHAGSRNNRRSLRGQRRTSSGQIGGNNYSINSPRAEDSPKPPRSSYSRNKDQERQSRERRSSAASSRSGRSSSRNRRKTSRRTSHSSEKDFDHDDEEKSKGSMNSLNNSLSSLNTSSRRQRSNAGRESRSFRRSSKSDLDAESNLVDLNETLNELGITSLPVASSTTNSSRRRSHNSSRPMDKQKSMSVIPSSRAGFSPTFNRKAPVGTKQSRSRSIEREPKGSPGLPRPGEPIKSKSVPVDRSTFDQLWKKELGHDSAGLEQFISGGQSGDTSDMVSLPGLGTSGHSKHSSHGISVERTKKTKLEKIHELQAKCDRYKQEWTDTTNSKRRYRKELETKKLEVISLTKKVETHQAETSILQKNLSEALQKLDDTLEEQRKERGELSNTAKELAQARIDHAKSVNEARELRARLDTMEGELKERDRQITTLTDELKTFRENSENLEADLLYADEQISKLEQEIKKIEEEVLMYREAAARDDGETNGENLREVREEMEKRLSEDREKRLDEKQRKLEEKMKLFEEEKKRHLEQQSKREQEFQEQQAQDSEKIKARDEDRQKRDDEINDRLRMLEEDNAALQGRLKSEQLDASMKIKNKDSIIDQLQNDLERFKAEQKERVSNPDGLTSLQEEVEIIKVNAETVRLELEDCQTQNKMLQEEVDDLQVVNKEMKTWVTTLEQATSVQKKEIEAQKRKISEWQKKSGEWSDKAFQWKDKAEMWEKKAKSLDPAANPETSSVGSVQPDPQALFLAAALEKKKATEGTSSGGNNSKWLGGIFKKASVDDDAQARIEELEVQTTKQSVEINRLKSEIVQIQSTYKERAYNKDQEIEQLQKQSEANRVKSANLANELELARKLNNMSIEDTS